MYYISLGRKSGCERRIFLNTITAKIRVSKNRLQKKTIHKNNVFFVNCFRCPEKKNEIFQHCFTPQDVDTQ